METLSYCLGALIIVQQAAIIFFLRKERKNFYRDIKMLYGSIATDLNAITSTIAVYTGQEKGRSLIVPAGAAAPGEGVPVDPVDAARRKAELWRALRARR